LEHNRSERLPGSDSSLGKRHHHSDELQGGLIYQADAKQFDPPSIYEPYADSQQSMQKAMEKMLSGIGTAE